MAIVPFILMIFINDSAVLLYGEIRCWSLLGFKGLTLNDLPRAETQIPQTGVP